MADVYVNSWAEFVEAIGVAGDTVYLPENAEWDMNEILPYGLQENVSFACSKIDGRGTRIKNLNLNSYCFSYSEQDIKVIHNLLMTDWIGTNYFFDLRYGSEWFRCAISGITSAAHIIYNSNSYNYSAVEMASCSINVESSANVFRIVSTGGGKYSYCRIEAHAANSSEGNIGNQNYLCCELAFYAPNATDYFSVYSFQNGNLLRGNLKSIPEISSSWAQWSGLTSVFSADMFADGVTSPFPDNFVACTEAQLKDAAYLRSLTFPIVVG